MPFSFCSNLTLPLKLLIYAAACLRDSDLSSSYLSILAMISLFCATCFSIDSLLLKFSSFINFSLAVYSPLTIEALEDAIDWARESGPTISS